MPTTVATEPGQAHQRAGLPHRHRGRHRVQGRVDVRGGRRHLLVRRRVAVQVPLGHPDAADVDRDLPLGHTAGPAEDEFGGAAADVGNQERPGIRSGGEFGGRPGEGQHRLLVTGEDLGRDAEHLFDHVSELGRVAGVPGGAGGDHPYRLRARARDDVRVVAQHGDGPGERLGRQAAGLVHALPEPDDLHPPGQVGQRGALGIDVGQQQAQRVRPAVHRGHPAGRRAGHWVSSGTLSAETQGPASHQAPAALRASRPNGFTLPAASSRATTPLARPYLDQCVAARRKGRPHRAEFFLWLILTLVLLDQIVRPLQTLANVVGALREEDYSFRARGAAPNDALGELARKSTHSPTF